MSDEVINYKPTMDLRFVRRTMNLLQPGEVIVRILQQRFIGDDGSERWIDVPAIDEKPA